MNEREAIEQLKLEIASVKGMTIDCDRYADFAEKTISSLNMAIAALERQVEKELDYKGDGYDDAGNIIFDTAICRTCGKIFEIDYDDDVNYCPDCGQRFKWKE